MKLTNMRRYFIKDALPLGYLKEGIIALSFDIGGVVAGFIVASQFNVSVEDKNAEKEDKIRSGLKTYFAFVRDLLGKK